MVRLTVVWRALATLILGVLLVALVTTWLRESPSGDGSYAASAPSPNAAAASVVRRGVAGPPTTMPDPPADGSVPGAAPVPESGDQPALDDLASACAGGNLEACDTLFEQSPPSSRYERYGETCGGRNTPLGACTALYAGPLPERSKAPVIPPARPPVGLGDDLALDSLAQTCSQGTLTDCDVLSLRSPVRSLYEIYGRTCGGRVEVGGFCVVRFADQLNRLP